MALVEIELTTDTCARLTWLMLSKAPIPAPWFALFGSTRLLSQPFGWQYPDLGVAPPGFVATPGTLPLRAAVTITHVSVDDLAANATAPGIAVSCTAWLVLTVEPGRLRLDLVRLESPGHSPQVFAPPLFIEEQALPLDGVDDVRAGAVILDTGASIATLRFAVGANDDLLAPPSNLLAQSDDNWLIRVSGDVFSDRVRRQLISGVTPPPAGTEVEDKPAAIWFQQPTMLGSAPGSIPPGAWGVFGSVGIKKIDACLDVDLSVGIATSLSLTPNMSNGRVDLVLRVSSDASDWDVFRCWVITGGVGSVIVGFVTNFVTGIIVAIDSLIQIAEFVRLEAGNEVKGTSAGGGFTKAGSDDTSTWYTGSVSLPSFPTGTTNSATVGADGLVVRGSVLLGAINRILTFQPNGGLLESHWGGSYSCRDHAWKKSYEVSSVTVIDEAVVRAPTPANPQGVKVIAGNGVTVFPTTVFIHPGPALLMPVSLDPGEWVYDSPTWSIGSPIITPRRTGTPPKGERVMFFLHTSAGIRRFDIGPVPAVGTSAAEPSAIILGLHDANCRMLTKLWTRIQEIKWLIDPPEVDIGMPAMRQWMLTFRMLPTQAEVVMHMRGNREQVAERHSFNGATSGVLELVTAANVDISVEHNLQKSEAEVRITQRWLLPVRSVRLPGRADGLFMTRSNSGTDTIVVVSIGKQLLALGRDGLFEWHGAERETWRRRQNPLSVSLPNGQVAAIAGDSLILAIASRPRGLAGAGSIAICSVE